MLQVYPQQAIATIEFDKIKSLLAAHCKTDADYVQGRRDPD